MQTHLGDPAQQILPDNMDSTDNLEFELTLPDDEYSNGLVTITFNGRVQSFPVQGSMGQIITTSLSGNIFRAMQGYQRRREKAKESDYSKR